MRVRGAHLGAPLWMATAAVLVAVEGLAGEEKHGENRREPGLSDEKGRAEPRPSF